jgi:1-aminocyclopropane-1-carboxylate synthase
MSAKHLEAISTLSGRAQECARPDENRNPIWDIYNNQWHPQNNPDGYVSIGVAENTLMRDELRDYINLTTKVTGDAFTYGDGPTGGKRLRKAVARFLNRKLSPTVPLNLEHVVITNGVSHSIEHASWAFCNPGDGFLLGHPYYGAFIADINLRPNVEVVNVTFQDIDPLSLAGVANYEKAILSAKQRGVTVRALMLCSPHNPLGRCYSRETIIEYLRLCEKYQIHFVCDEIYAFSVWKNKHDTNPPPVEFTSVLSIPLDGIIEPSLVHVLYGMSKDFGANGLRVGYIISQHNPAFLKALVEVSIYSYASAVAEIIAANILEDDEWVDNFIETNQSRLSENHSFVVEFLNKHQISYSPGSNAAFFLWVNLGEAYLRGKANQYKDQDITKEVMGLLLNNRVFLANGSNFGAETPGVFRIVFSHPKPYLEEALKRVVEAIGLDDVPEVVENVEKLALGKN